MNGQRKVRLGDNVFTKSPQLVCSDCVSLTGDVERLFNKNGTRYATVKGYVAKMGGGYESRFTIPYSYLGIRIGTPISKISTRPGASGYAQWCRISRSWGY